MVDLLVREVARDDIATAAPADPIPNPRDPAAVPPRPVNPGFEWPRSARRVQAAFRGHPYRQDVVLALTVFLLTLLPSQAGQGSELLHASPLLVVTSVIAAAVLIWRRRAPIAMYVVVLTACTVEWGAAQSSATDISWMICLYTVARYRSMATLRFALVAIVPGLAVLLYRLAPVQGPILVSFFFLGTGIVASAALGLMARERQAQLAALAERAHHAEQEREQRARLAVLAERARFSRETHDIVGHSLAVIIGLADGGARQVEAHPWRGRQVFELIAETSRQSLADLRHTLGALREHGSGGDGRGLDGIGGTGGIGGIGAEAFAPQPGIVDISDLLERTRSAGPRVSCRTSGETSALPRSLQSAVYRIVQESLTNCLKHAGPDTSVRVVIEADARMVKMSIADTGPAGVRRTLPPLSGSVESHGLGLAGVHERAALAGGKAEAGPNDVGGWTVAARFPLLPAGEA